MKRLLLILLLAAAPAWAQIETFPPESAGGGGTAFTGGDIANPLGLPDGTQAAPGLYFTNDPNTGIFREAADEINFTTGGGEQLELRQTGTAAFAYFYNKNWNGGAGRETLQMQASATTNNFYMKEVDSTTNGFGGYSNATNSVMFSGSAGKAGRLDVCCGNSSALRFETDYLGTAYTDFKATTPTGVRTVTVPDLSGTVVLNSVSNPGALSLGGATATTIDAGANALTLDGGTNTYFQINGSTQVTLTGSAFWPEQSRDIDLGTTSRAFNVLYLDKGIGYADTTTLTEGVATTVLTVTYGSGGIIGNILWGASASDATDTQVLKGELAVACTNDAGTTSCTTTDVHADITNVTAGTLTCTESLTYAANAFNLQLDCTSSLTQTSFQAWCRVDMTNVIAISNP